MTKRIFEIGTMMMLGINYAAAYVIAFIWNWPSADSKLLVFILHTFIVSLMFGALITDMKKTLLYIIASTLLGIFLAVVIISAPSLLSPENIELYDVSLNAALVSVSRFFLIAVTFVIIGAITGCFLGDVVSERSETQQ